MIANQDEQPEVTVLSDHELDTWLAEYSEEEIEALVALWQKFAGKRYKNMIVAEEDDAQSA